MAEARGIEDELPPIEDDFDESEAFVRRGGVADDPRDPAVPATRSAGGVVVVRATEAGPRIAVMECGGFVSLPRAEVGPGESAETAAKRAGQAFLGASVSLLETLGETHEDQDRDDVCTWFWLARARRPALLKPGNPPPPGFALHWLDIDEAADALDSDEESALLGRIGRDALPRRKRAFASGEHRALRHDLDALRDMTVAGTQTAEDPARADALVRARLELERAEERLARGDDAGARRAHERAEREALAVLDGPGRAAALRRALARLSEDQRASLGIAPPTDGEVVALDLVLTVQSAVEAANEERARRAHFRRAAQIDATLALAATLAGVMTAASLGLFHPPTAEAGSHGSELLAAVYLAAGALGGWAGEALNALRTRGPDRGLSLPLAAAAGGLAGLAMGAFLTGGLGGIPDGTNAALTVAAAYATGWLGRRAVPSGR